MTTEVSKSKALIVTAWTFLLLSSALPRIILQEAFKYPVSNQLATAIPAVVIVLGLVLTFIWDTVRDLRRFLLVALVLVVVEWLVYNKVSELFFYQAWLKHPSFNVYMLAQQSLRLLVTLVILAALFMLKNTRVHFSLSKAR